MYAVVAPGFSCVYTNWQDVVRIKALYPYPKWCKCYSEAEAIEWIQRNSYGRKLSRIYNYGNTLNDMYIDAKYKIEHDCIYYVLDCRRVGNIRVNAKDVLIEYKGSKIFIKLPNIFVSDETVAGHMSAIHNLLQIVGDYIDINIELPYYSLYYCLTVYSRGNNRPVMLTRQRIDERLGEVALSLKMLNLSEEDYDNGSKF